MDTWRNSSKSVNVKRAKPKIKAKYSDAEILQIVKDLGGIAHIQKKLSNENLNIENASPLSSVSDIIHKISTNHRSSNVTMPPPISISSLPSTSQEEFKALTPNTPHTPYTPYTPKTPHTHTHSRTSALNPTPIPHVISFSQATKNIHSRTPSMTRSTTSIKKQREKYVIELLRNDDFYHLFAKKFHLPVTFADKMTSFVLSKYMIYIYIALFIVLSVVFIIDIDFLRIGFFCCFMVWVIALLLVMNISMLKYILQTFEFWFKLYFAIIFIIFYFLLFTDVNKLNDKFFLNGILIFFFLIIIPVIVMSLNDAWHTNRCLKVSFTIFPIFFFLLYYALIFFYLSDTSVFVFGRAVSVRDRALSALTTLIIFTIKQTVYVVKDPRKASVLSVRPTILWIIEDPMENVVGTVGEVHEDKEDNSLIAVLSISDIEQQNRG